MKNKLDFSCHFKSHTVQIRTSCTQLSEDNAPNRYNLGLHVKAPPIMRSAKSPNGSGIVYLSREYVEKMLRKCFEYLVCECEDKITTTGSSNKNKTQVEN